MRGWAGVLRAALSDPGPVPGRFRERFDFGGRDVASWFPGHMAKGEGWERGRPAPRFRRRSPSAVLQACGRCGPPCGAPTASSRCTTLAYPPPRPVSPPGAHPPCTGSSRPAAPSPSGPPLLPLPYPSPSSPQPHHTPPPPSWSPSTCSHASTVTLLSGTHIPLSGRNPMLQEALGIRPHVLVLNKVDLADPRRQPVSTGAGTAGWGPMGHRRQMPAMPLPVPFRQSWST